VTPATLDRSATVRLSEVLAALSLASDVGHDQPLEKSLRNAVIAARLGMEIGLGREELSDVDGKATDGPDSEAAADGVGEKKEWGAWNEWEGEAEPRFKVARKNRVVPHSPAAG